MTEVDLKCEAFTTFSQMKNEMFWNATKFMPTFAVAFYS